MKREIVKREINIERRTLNCGVSAAGGDVAVAVGADVEWSPPAV